MFTGVSTEELGEDIPRYVERLKTIFARLPSANLTTFKYVVRGMYRISERREVNKMTGLNLAVCIGPDLMRPASDDLQMVLQLPIANEVLGVIIENTKDIFPEE